MSHILTQTCDANTHSHIKKKSNSKCLVPNTINDRYLRKFNGASDMNNSGTFLLFQNIFSIKYEFT